MIKDKIPPSSVLFKLTARCNLKCTYCYMFEHADQSYLEKPPAMSKGVFFATIDELARVAKKYGWEKVSLSLHGGEPLLVGKKYLREVLEYVRKELSFVDEVSISLQTNAVLVDDEWIDIFLKYNVSVGVSLDGPKETNDLKRLDHKGQGTYDKIVKGLRVIQGAQEKKGLNFGGVLAVIEPFSNGRKVFEHFVDVLGIKWMDFLLPDVNYDDFGDYHRLPPLSYARFLNDVFDAWWERNDPNIHVRTCENIVDLLIGGNTSSESMGSGMADLLVVETDGSIEPLDVLRIAEDSYTRQDLYIGKNSFEEFSNSVLMQALNKELQELPASCSSCRYQKICHGGYLPHRYSQANGYKNPSFYCIEIKATIEHIWQKVSGCLQSKKNSQTEFRHASAL